jgi:hypothetical protein
MYYDLSKIRRILVILVPLAFGAIMIWIKLHSPAEYLDLNYEDHLIQNIQFALLLLGGIVLLVAARRAGPTSPYLRWATILGGAALLFMAGEEITWGQGIFHFGVPTYFAQNNVQDSLTIHNLTFFENKQDVNYMLVGLAGSLAWLLPGRVAKWWASLKKWCIPPWYMSLYFLPLAVDGFLWEAKSSKAFLGGFFVGWRNVLERHMCWCDQEPAEFLWYFGMLLIAFNILWLVSRRREARGT